MTNGTWTTRTGRKVINITAMDKADMALRRVNALTQSIEKKTLDVVGNDGTLAQTGLATSLFLPGQGTTDDDRVGDKVTVKRVSMRMKIESLGTAAKPYGYVRVILLYVKTPLTSAPAVTDFLESAVPYSLFKKDTPIHYKILYDKNFYMVDWTNTNTGQTGTGRAEYILDKSLPIPKKGLTYDTDGTNTVGRFMQILLHDYENEDISVNWQYRFKFTDL